MRQLLDDLARDDRSGGAHECGEFGELRRQRRRAVAQVDRDEQRPLRGVGDGSHHAPKPAITGPGMESTTFAG